MKQRYWEIDFVRGIAVILMIVFHIAFDLATFKGVALSPFTGGWFWVGRISALLFILLVGVSTAIMKTQYSGIAFFYKNLKRAAVIMIWALGISIATYWFDADRMIQFGILHFIATAIVIAQFFAQFTWVNLIIAYSIWNILPHIISGSTGSSLIHIALGIPPASFQSYDYYPLIPWFSVVLLGIALGNLLYRKKPVRHGLSQTMQKAISPITLAGKHSLAVYILHQPIILLVLKFL